MRLDFSVVSPAEFLSFCHIQPILFLCVKRNIVDKFPVCNFWSQGALLSWVPFWVPLFSSSHPPFFPSFWTGILKPRGENVAKATVKWLLSMPLVAHSGLVENLMLEVSHWCKSRRIASCPCTENFFSFFRSMHHGACRLVSAARRFSNRECANFLSGRGQSLNFWR